MKRVISVFLIISLLILGYFFCFFLSFFNIEFYSMEFSKYDVYNEFSFDVDELNSDLLDYLNGGEFNWDVFNSREIKHLEDVKDVISGIGKLYVFLLFFCFLLVFTLFFLDRNGFFLNFGRILFFSGLVVVIFTFILLVFIVVGFDGVFTLFHKVLFEEGSWVFLPSDNLVRLYPIGFFYDIALNIFSLILYYGNILIGVGLLFLKND